MPVPQLPVALAERGPHGVDDHGVRHRANGSPAVHRQPQVDDARTCSAPGATRVDDGPQRVDLVVVEPRREVALHGPPVRDVHLPPQRTAAAGQLDRHRAMVALSPPSWRTHPPLLLEPVEPATETRPHEPQLGSASSLGRADPPQRCSAASTSNQPSDRSHSARRSASIARSSAAATDLQLAPRRHPGRVESCHERSLAAQPGPRAVLATRHRPGVELRRGGRAARCRRPARARRRSRTSVEQGPVPHHEPRDVEPEHAAQPARRLVEREEAALVRRPDHDRRPRPADRRASVERPRNWMRWSYWSLQTNGTASYAASVAARPTAEQVAAPRARPARPRSSSARSASPRRTADCASGRGRRRRTRRARPADRVGVVTTPSRSSRPLPSSQAVVGATPMPTTTCVGRRRACRRRAERRRPRSPRRRRRSGSSTPLSGWIAASAVPSSAPAPRISGAGAAFEHDDVGAGPARRRRHLEADEPGADHDEPRAPGSTIAARNASASSRRAQHVDVRRVGLARADAAGASRWR